MHFIVKSIETDANDNNRVLTNAGATEKRRLWRLERMAMLICPKLGRLAADLALAVAMLAICNAGSSASASGLTFSSVDKNAEQEQKEFAPLQDYLARALRPAGVDQLEFVVYTNNDDAAAGLVSGEVDFHIDSAVLAALIAEQTGALPFLRSWKSGIPEYSSIIFVRADSSFQVLDDLLGHVVAFRRRESTPAFFMPAAYIAEAGIPLVAVGDGQREAASEGIGYTFSQGDRNTVAWVVMGRVAAGATKSTRFDDEEYRAVRDQLRVIAETPALPRQVVVRRHDLEPRLVEAVRVVMTEIHTSADGAAALEVFEETAKFDEFPEGGDVVFERIRSMLERLEAAVEPTS